jgi:isopropylmalate/homocitrate/citramalate synthase
VIDENKKDKENFIFPQSSYRGEFTPENLVFNANLQEFAQKVSYICNLETNGKITPQDAYKQIKNLWAELKTSIKNLGLNDK